MTFVKKQRNGSKSSSLKQRQKQKTNNLNSTEYKAKSLYKMKSEEQK